MKTYSKFIKEAYGKFIPIDASKQSATAIANILAARRKAEEEARDNANLRNATSFHKSWSKEQKIKAIMAGSPGMSREEAAKKASLRIGKQKKVDEATSTNDPNRGRMWRKKPLVPQGMMPDDTKDPRTGKRVKSSGKVQKRLSTLSDAGRNEYYKKFGIRSRAASRGGKTQRLYWGLYEEKEVDDEGGMAMGELKSIIANANDIISMLKPDSQLEGWVQSKITKSADYISSVKDYLSNTPNSISEEEEKKKDRYEGEESTSSMIARLVARRHRKLGMKVPADVERDIDPKYKTKED